GQQPKLDRPRPPLRPSAPPWPPASTAGGAQPRSRHPLQALLLDTPEGPSFPQHAAVDHSRQAGSDRTLTPRRWWAVFFSLASMKPSAEDQKTHSSFLI